MVIRVRTEEVRSISNAALIIGVVLARTPLPGISIFVINVRFARRMLETQESTGENRDRVLVVGNASEPAGELGINVVGEVLVADLSEKCVKSSSVQVEGTIATIRTRGSP